MEKLFFRLFFIAIVFFGAFIYSFPWNAYDIKMPFTGQDYKLGLDLQGGVELDYKVELSEAEKEDGYNKQKQDSIIEGLKSIIDKRIQSLNINDSIISSANYAGEQHIIVQIPLKGEDREQDNENIRKAKEAIGKVMKIEFKEPRKNISEEDLKARQELSSQAMEELKNSNYNFFVTANKYKDLYENIETGTSSGTQDKLGFDLSNITGTGLVNQVITGTGTSQRFLGEAGYWIVSVKNIEEKEFDEIVEKTETSTGLTSTGGTSTGELSSISITGTNSGITAPETEIIKIKKNLYTYDYMFLSARPSDWISAKDSQGRILNDKYFLNSSVQYTDTYKPVIELTFNPDGAKIFGELTEKLLCKTPESRYLCDRFAIFVGGEMLTYPTVSAVIKSGKAIIEGGFTTEEANKLSNDINTGVIPAPIYLTSEKSIDARLGLDSLQKLIASGLAGIIIIFLFLAFSYRLSGIAAGVALIFYGIIVLAIVKVSGMVLTLASIAGLVLSIGIAIDANILIFERIKDELANGVNIKKAVKVGFEKSWTAIWDSNITGLIIALILFIFGINMIKGFGLMLAIGIVVSLFTAMWVSRIFIYTLAKKEGISIKSFIGKVKMQKSKNTKK